MSANNEAPERQAHDALLRLGRLGEGPQRDDAETGSAPPAPTPNQEAPPVTHLPQDPAARARLESLVERAQQGDETVLPELRQVLDNHPELWQRCGDLALQAQTAWLQRVCGKDLVLRESLQRQLEQLKGELAGKYPTRL